MSIRSALEKLSGQSGPLRLHVPVRRSFTVERHIFLGPHVQRFVDCHEELETKFHQVAGRTLALFDRFSNGSYLTFGVNPHDKKSVSWIARVDPVSEGIVDFRITDPNPAVRVFGGFAMPDVLVLLTWGPREGMDFRAEVARCKEQWKSHFVDHEPVVSDRVQDHVSKQFRIG